jgi:hypothetical protein
MMTESEAKNKRCPFSLPYGTGIYITTTCCMGSNCMAWSWYNRKQGTGYCRLLKNYAGPSSR